MFQTKTLVLCILIVVVVIFCISISPILSNSQLCAEAHIHSPARWKPRDSPKHFRSEGLGMVCTNE